MRVKGLTWLLESWKNQSESWKSPGKVLEICFWKRVRTLCKESFASLASLVFSLTLPPDLQPIHSHVVRALFCILLKFKQAKWKNCPFSYNGLWHLRTLSEGNGFFLHKHMQSSSRASSKFSFVFLPFDFLLLAPAVFWHRGQNHLLGTFWTFKQVKWKEEMGHAWLLHVTIVSVVFILQKQTELRPVDGWDTFLFLVYHLPRISGRTQYLQKWFSLGTTEFQWQISGRILSQKKAICSLKPQTTVTIIVSSSEYLLLWLVIVCMFSFKTCSSIFWLQTWVGLLRVIFEVCILQTIGALYGTETGA